MRTALLCLALSLAGAGCGGGSEYRRTAPPAVRPPSTSHTPAGTGLKEPGKPERTPDFIRPGPRNQRYIQPRQDGRPAIYAADGDAQRTLELRIRRPVPGRVPEGTTREAWKKCWEEAQALMLADARVLRLSEADMECVRHRVIQNCMGWLMGRAEKVAKGEGRPEDAEVLRRYFSSRFNQNEWDEAFTNRRVHRACDDRGAYRRDVVRLANDLERMGYETRGWRDGVP